METAAPTGVITPEPKFGPLQGLWLVGGYLLASFLGAVLVGMAWGMAIGIKAGEHGAAPVMPKPGVDLLAGSLLAGVLLAAAWGIAYPLNVAKPLLRLGDAHGIAWRRSANQGYLVAVGFAIVLVAVVWGLARLIPPDVSKLTGPLERLMLSHGWPRVVAIVSALVIAPPVEEFVFRGAFFASLARRWGVLAATLVTTLVFTLFHAADKIHYWPGFVDVALLSFAAIFLRLRYRSLWPAIGLHFFYNAALLLL